jgi:hypothetical protein
VTGYATPEDAVRAEDPVPSQYARVVAVDYSPDRNHAVVMLEYNEPPTVEPYVVLCEHTPSGWVEGQGGSGGGISWMATRADGTEGVEVAWGRPPRVRWEVPLPDEPEPPPDALPW